MMSTSVVIPAAADLPAQAGHTTDRLTWANYWDHFLARIGVNRAGHRVAPGLYVLGNPTPAAPVLVTANYTLSFDALRSALKGIAGYILVLDTHGVNVWCAAGKGTFGTDELVRRIEITGLKEVVKHRQLILPQLGAPGVAAHEVKKRSTFSVEYGPVRAADLPEYLQTGEKTPAMRAVRFTLWDRILVSGIEIAHFVIPLSIIALLLQFSAWFAVVLAALVAGLFLLPITFRFLRARSTVSIIELFLEGVILWPFILLYLNKPAAMLPLAVAVAGFLLFPILLPWIPTPNFSTKGFILGGLAALPVIGVYLNQSASADLGLRIGWALAYWLFVASLTAFVALNFTGSTTYTSKTGVRYEYQNYIPVMLKLFGLSLGLMIALKIIGGW